ncbi:MAG: helix-turn-helix transcriptional regulator [Myxococcales bacterium]|nr:helix-turn-helix transcriptional regulator [Myxococcales bacterium]
MPTVIPGREAVAFVTQAQFALGLTQETIAERLGISRRTVSRWVAGGSRPDARQLAELARAVHPLDAALAAKLAAEAGQTLEELGLATPRTAPAPDAASARPFPPLPMLVEAVVCAAADAMELPPSVVRKGLRSAVARARSLGLTLEEVERALSPGATGPAERARKSRKASPRGAP